MKNSAIVESVTDESGTDHRVRVIFNGVSLTSDWTRKEVIAMTCANEFQQLLANQNETSSEVQA